MNLKQLNLSSVDGRELLAKELEVELATILKAWFPRCLDQQHGGFLSDFDYKWRPRGPQLKMLEHQARMLRLISRVAAHPGYEHFREFATHGFKYLRDVLWDHEYGGWFRMLDRAGTPLEAQTKHGHGASYAISACAAYYEITSDPAALDLAMRAFAWMEKVGHDSEYGGYFALYTRDGRRVLSQDQCPIPNTVRDCIGTPLGLKDANTNADMLDTAADLYRIWPDALVGERLVEMANVVCNRMIVPPGAVHMYFQPDWTPVPDFARYPYGLNTANILARSLQSPPLSSFGAGPRVVKSVIDSVLAYGWDESAGGFFYGGSTFGATYVDDLVVLIRDKFWWPQAEGLRSLLRMGLLYPEDERNYIARFSQLWSYIRDHLIDHSRGGWLQVGTDSKPRRWGSPKASVWKEPSHEVHSLLECVRLLRSPQ